MPQDKHPKVTEWMEKADNVLDGEPSDNITERLFPANPGYKVGNPDSVTGDTPRRTGEKTDVDVTQQIARITSKLVKRANRMVPEDEQNSPNRHASSVKDGSTSIMVTNRNARPMKQIAVDTADANGNKHYHDAAVEGNYGVRTLSDDQWTGHSGEFFWAKDDGPKAATKHFTQEEVIQGSAQTLASIRDAVQSAETHRKEAA